MSFNDPLWNEFQPLWTSLQRAKGQVLVAGGYGLFLKQSWLLQNRIVTTVIPITNWMDSTPRATNDIDLVLGLELLGSKDSQDLLVRALTDRGFAVVQEHPKWKFEKKVAGGRIVVVEFHAHLPEETTAQLSLDNTVIKPDPATGKKEVHARQNPEAAGSEFHPFAFNIEGLPIVVPNPVTWAVMKLVAARDRWGQSQDFSKDPKVREVQRLQAIKHARDVFRIVAMTTRDERDRTEEILQAIGGEDSMNEAVVVCEEFFGKPDGFGAIAAAGQWQANDLTTIQGLLAEWFH